MLNYIFDKLSEDRENIELTRSDSSIGLVVEFDSIF